MENKAKRPIVRMGLSVAVLRYPAVPQCGDSAEKSFFGGKSPAAEGSIAGGADGRRCDDAASLL